MIEEWRPVPGYETYYEVSSCGRVRSVTRSIYRKHSHADTYYHHHFYSKLLKIQPTRDGNYTCVNLHKNNKPKSFRVHRLILMAFSGMPEKGQVARHLDGNSHNNHVSNLAWGSYSENNLDSRNHGVNNQMPPLKQGENHYKAALTKEDVIYLRAIPYYRGMYAKLARQYGITTSGIHNAIKGFTWRSIPLG